MAYNPRYTYGGELRHGREFLSKGGLPNKNHRYVDKIPLGGNRYRYIYPEDIEAAKAAQAKQKGINAASAQKFETSRLGNLIEQKRHQKQSARDANELQVQRGIAAGRERAAAREARNKGIGGFFRKASNALGGVAGNVGKALASATGNIRTTMRKTGDTVGNWLNDRRRDLGNLWDGSAGAGSAKDKANAARENAKIYRENARRDLKSGNKKRGLAYAKANREQWEEANRQQEAYDNSIVGRLDKAGRDVGNWLNGRRRDAENAFNTARDNIGNTARDIRNRVGEAWDGSAGAGSAKDKANAARENARTYRMYAGRNAKSGDNAKGSAYAKASREQQAEANRQQRAYDNSILGRAENFGRNVSKAARNVGQKVGKTANDASTFLNNRVGDARSALKSAKTTATQRIGELRNTISSLPGNVQKRAESIIKDIKSGKTAAEIQAKEIELENLVRNTVTGGSRMPSDDYLDKIDPPKKKKK